MKSELKNGFVGGESRNRKSVEELRAQAQGNLLNSGGESRLQLFRRFLSQDWLDWSMMTHCSQL